MVCLGDAADLPGAGSTLAPLRPPALPRVDTSCWGTVAAGRSLTTTVMVEAGRSPGHGKACLATLPLKATHAPAERSLPRVTCEPPSQTGHLARSPPSGPTLSMRTPSALNRAGPGTARLDMSL